MRIVIPELATTTITLDNYLASLTDKVRIRIIAFRSLEDIPKIYIARLSSYNGDPSDVITRHEKRTYDFVALTTDLYWTYKSQTMDKLIRQVILSGYEVHGFLNEKEFLEWARI